jgi:hypothetical protein
MEKTNVKKIQVNVCFAKTYVRLARSYVKPARSYVCLAGRYVKYPLRRIAGYDAGEGRWGKASFSSFRSCTWERAGLGELHFTLSDPYRQRLRPHPNGGRGSCDAAVSRGSLGLQSRQEAAMNSRGPPAGEAAADRHLLLRSIWEST